MQPPLFAPHRSLACLTSLSPQQVRLFHRAVVVANNQSGSMRGIVLQLSIDQFENESRRVATGLPMAPTPHKFMVADAARTNMFSVNATDPGVHR